MFALVLALSYGRALDKRYEFVDGAILASFQHCFVGDGGLVVDITRRRCRWLLWVLPSSWSSVLLRLFLFVLWCSGMSRLLLLCSHCVVVFNPFSLRLALSPSFLCLLSVFSATSMWSCSMLLLLFYLFVSSAPSSFLRLRFLGRRKAIANLMEDRCFWGEAGRRQGVKGASQRLHVLVVHI